MILTDIYPVFIVPLVLLLVIFMLFYSVKPILFIFHFEKMTAFGKVDDTGPCTTV